MPTGKHGLYTTKYIDINISDTLNILEYAVEVNSKVLIYSTSFQMFLIYGINWNLLD